MNWVRYWSRARLDLDGREDPNGSAIAFGWSDVSPEDARGHAELRASRLAKQLREIFREGKDVDEGIGWPIRHGDYYVSEDRPLREPEVESFEVGGERVAVVTRNAYGCYVLNVERVMFIDIDQTATQRRPGLFARLFLGAKPVPLPGVEQRVREAVSRHRGLGLRLFRTAAGHRALVTSGTYDPESADAHSLMRDFGCDRLYATLCERQRCFRARLSPKPWRIGMPAPQQHYYPWDDDSDRRERFEDWTARYDGVRDAVSVCEEIGRFGSDAVDPAVQPIVDLHDRWCCTGRPRLA